MTARDHLEEEIRRELVGPVPGAAPRGKPIDLSSRPLRFESWEDARGPWYEDATGQEVLTESDPLRRYGVGILYPKGRPAGSTRAGQPGPDLTGPGSETAEPSLAGESLPTNDDPDQVPATPEITGKQPSQSLEGDTDDFDLSDANSFQPSAMGLSFRLDTPTQDSAVTLTCSGAYYEPVPVLIAGSERERTWWVRRPVTLTAQADRPAITTAARRLSPLGAAADPAAPSVEPQLAIYARPRAGEQHSHILTAAAVNASNTGGSAGAFFQAHLEVTAHSGATIEPYPGNVATEAPPGSEELSLQLLYRHKQPYAVGHGCAAVWDDSRPGLVETVRAEPLPAYEVPSLTPDVTVPGDNGEDTQLRVSMHDLATKPTDGAGRDQVEQVLAAYGRWVEDRDAEASGLPTRLRPAARDHLDQCRYALKRMRTGWALVQGDPHAREAFCRANEAMLHQQQRSRLPVREVRLTRERTFEIDGNQPVVQPGSHDGYWRPFQIAFILACLEELIYAERPNRELVDLIFFPTGGGKTEAYLGAAAVSLIARRLRDPQDAGTDVLMRYTLRLLTAQQFVRAASLICVLESMREKHGDMGTHPISIGIWLGGDSTPNTHKAALDAQQKLRTDPYAANLFLLLRCPWCGTRMGPIPSPGKKKGRELAGYVKVDGNKKARLRCPDLQCDFGGRRGLPIYVVDEDIYSERPSLVIGTVDKFAMLAWRPAARAMFGLNHNGSRACSPPGLVIQDELHLISGPLGSMVGLYEAVIENLCTSGPQASPIKPKIIASTATIRQYGKQIHDLYGRSRAALFPPHGLEEGESFFAKPARQPDGTLARGRRYLGVLAPALGSIQSAQVRIGAATLQAAHGLPEDDRDPYWTNLNFLNSLRELGNTVSLLQSDIPDYLQGVWRRDGLDPRELRNPRNVLELTSRRRSDEIPKAIEELSLTADEDGCVDVCLASNIIEVGVDIDRLSLMTVVGQPKTTAQYIQVSGRVGRRWWERPGLVVTVYAPSRPRDRSHYERFTAYHQQLYAQVEPTTLTPFSAPVLQRALVGALLAFIRQNSPSTLMPDPFPADWYTAAVSLLRERAEQIDRGELESFDREVGRREREWERGERTEWNATEWNGNKLQGLMRFPGTPVADGAGMSWEVPTSMRTVDAECLLRITPNYTFDDPPAGGA